MKHTILHNQEDIDSIIKKCKVCHVSMVDENNMPYVVAYNFGYKDGVVYLHSSKEGKKIDILRNNPNVCISFNTGHELRYQSEQVACSWSMKYRSVIAYGKVEFIEDIEAKRDFLSVVMGNYADRAFTFNEPALREVCTYKVKVEKFTGRIYGY